MKILEIKILSVILVVVVAVSAMVFVSYAELFPLKKEIYFETIHQSADNLVEFTYYGNATESETTIASLNVRVDQEFNNQRKIRVDVQHEANTELDVVTVEFCSSDIMSVAFQGYSSTSYRISRNIDRFFAVVTYDRAIGVIEGSTPLEFVVTTTGLDGDFSLSLQTVLYMHYKQPLELTQLRATKELYVSLAQAS